MRAFDLVLISLQYDVIIQYLLIIRYWVTQKLPQICTVFLRIRIGKVAWFAVYICGNFWVTQYFYLLLYLQLKDIKAHPSFNPFWASEKKKWNKWSRGRQRAVNIDIYHINTGSGSNPGLARTETWNNNILKELWSLFLWREMHIPYLNFNP